MSSTIVRDCAPLSGAGDKGLVVVMGEDGSPSIEPDVLHNLLSMGGNAMPVSVVRLTGTDPETETVDVTVDTFFETDVSSSQNIMDSKIIEDHTDMINDEMALITEMWGSVHLDHCYTPHTSPDPKHDSVSTSSDIVEPSTSKLKLSGAQEFNSSTEDLVAVLSSFDTNVDIDTKKVLQQNITKNNIASAPLPVKQIPPLQVESKINLGSTKLKNVNKISPQTYSKKTNIPLTKKSLKIVTVTKPAIGLKVAPQNVQNQPSEDLKDFFNEDSINTASNTKVTQINNKELSGIKEIVDNDELSDISSDPDYFDDDSADSDFETLNRKSLPKTKQVKKPVIKRSNKITPIRDKQILKSRAPRSKVKNLNKKSNLNRGRIVSPNEKDPKLKIETEKRSPTAAKSEIPLTPSVTDNQSDPTKSLLDSSKKVVKKKIQKPAELFDDGIALFSTPDVIRRVSTSSKSGDLLKSNEDKVNDFSNKSPNKVTRSLSSDQKDQNILKNMPCDESRDIMIDPETVLSHNVHPSPDSTNRDISHLNESILDQNINTTDAVNQSIIDQNDQNLSNLNYDHANLDLDLNTEELIPEDLLYQVAKLVENADIQKVIDTNLTLVEQNLPDIDQEINKSTEEDSFSVKEIMTGENLANPSAKDLQKIIGGDLNNVSIVTNTNLAAQMQSRNECLGETALHNEQKDIAIGHGGIITKNNTNKPLQIIRPDGRVITIPPLEKPATRSSKKKQEDGDFSVIHNTPLTQDLKVKKPAYSTTENIKRSSTEDTVLQPEDHFVADDADMSDSDESWKSEDDPDRLWCICKQPHNNRFMICCDTCEEWFHGQCVGISKALGRQMEQQGKEWQCPNCQKTKKSALQAALNDAHADMPISPSRDTNQDGENISRRRCIVCKAPSRSESVYCSEKCIVQHSNTVERVVVFERATGKCLSGSNAPTVANLKQWLKEHPGFEVVSSGNKTYTQTKLPFVKTDKASLSVKSSSNLSRQKHLFKNADRKPSLGGMPEGKTLSQLTFYGKQSVTQTSGGKTYIMKTQSVSAKPGIKQVPTPQKTTKLTLPHTLPIKQPVKIKQTAGSTNTSVSPHTTKVQSQTVQTKSNITPQKISRQKSVSERTSVSAASPSAETKSPAATKAPEELRENVRKTLAEHISIRLKDQSELKMTEDEVKQLSTDIESELYSLFNKDTGAKYRNRYRSLVFNIKDTKNTTLWRRVVEKSISPKELVRLSPEELASQELAQWREREAKHQLEMIKKSELDLLNCARTYVLKSHKGEEVIEKRAEVDSIIVAELDGSMNEDSRTTAVETIGDRPPSRTNSLKELTRGKDEKDRHRRESSASSSTKHNKSNKDEKDKEKLKESRGKHKDGSRYRDRKKRSRSHSRDRRSDGSKDKKDSKKSRRRSRSGSRHKSTERENKRHKEKHRDHNRHKSSSSRHKSTHKDSGSDSTTSKSSHDKIFSDLGKAGSVAPSSDLDKKSKEILEGLVDNKVVAPLEDRLWKHVQEQDVPASACDSESDHEPSSTVTIATPPHSNEQEDKNVDKMSESLVKGGSTVSSPIDSGLTVMPSIKSLPIPHLTSADGPNVWEGYINMVDVAKFYITAQEVSGDCTGLSSELPSGLDIVGRISPDTVWDYLSKMRRSTAKHISILRLTAANVEEHMPYHALYTYLSSRKRFGVVKTTDTSIKDFYIMPQASYNPLPQVLLPLNGPGFEESRPHLLLGIIVSSKRKRSFQQSVNDIVIPASKKVKESPPRSYTPPPNIGNKDPRLRQQISSVLPPLPQVGPLLDLPKPPSHDDDMDEPYSPEDSDDGAPSTTILSSVTNTKDISSYVPSTSVPSLMYTTESKQPVSDLSTFEPFKTANFSSIPGLDTAAIPINSTGTLGVSNLLNTLSSTATSGIVSNEKLLSTSNSLNTMLTTGDFLNSTGFDNSISTIDKSDLQKKMDELNQQIEQQKQEIQNISQGIVGKEDLGSSCLANIALPSNLQQILDSIKTSNSSQSAIDSSQDSNDLTKTLGHSLSIPPPTIIPNLIPPPNTLMEEYCTQTSKNNAKTNYTPGAPLIQSDNPVVTNTDKVQSTLPTIPLILPKLNTRAAEANQKPQSEINLTIPLNLPRPKRSFSAISDAKSDSALQSIPLNLPKVKKISSPKSDGDVSSNKCDNSKSTDSTTSKQTGSVLSSLSEEDLIRKAAEMLGTKPDDKEAIPEVNLANAKQTDSVLSSLSEEELIRKAAEMLGETETSNEPASKEDDDDDDDDDDEPYDPGESQPVSIKQGPILYTPGQIKKTKFPEVDQPPIPGMEDYEEDI